MREILSSGLVVIRDGDEDGFLLTESSIVEAQSRMKVSGLLFDHIRLRGHRRHVLGVLADHSKCNFEALESLFDRAIATVPTPARDERTARREALIRAAERSGFANPEAVGAEFDRWAAENDLAPGAFYGHSPVSWLESVLLGGAKFIATPEQAEILKQILKPEAFDSSIKFDAPLIDVSQLEWPDIIDLRKNPRLLAFRAFVVDRLPGDVEPERVKDEMRYAYQRLVEDIHPHGSGHVAVRIVGQVPCWMLPINPFGIARDIFGAIAENRMLKNHGHLFFIHDANNKISIRSKKPGLLRRITERLRETAEYLLG